MNSSRTIRLRWLHGMLGPVSLEETGVQLWRATPHTWQPLINAFRCESAVHICVDLAGVDKSFIDLRVEPDRLLIRGTRTAPEPTDEQGRAIQVLALEIDYGPFEREVALPEKVDVKRARAEQENGLLWIFLPLEQ